MKEPRPNIYKTLDIDNENMLAPMRTFPRNTKLRPFLKWAGGKGQMLERLEPFLPESFDTYYEPFLGGGALFFYLASSGRKFKAFLSDSNEELILTYEVVKDAVEELIVKLKEHSKNYNANPEKYFYDVRTSEPSSDVEKAAKLIFLNRTCFNGLYRVNSKNKFNVPFGSYKNPKICDEVNLRAVSSVLRWSKAKLLTLDYEEATKDSKKGDFIYFDPPYQPFSSTANFTSYTKQGFDIEDQKNLCQLFFRLRDRGCHILLSNSDSTEIRRLYSSKEFSVLKVSAFRNINCKGNSRADHSELIIKSN